MFSEYEHGDLTTWRQQQDKLALDLQKAQQTLQETQHKLSFLVERNPLAIIQWNTAFEVEDWNPAAESIFGYSKQEALNRHAVELIVPGSAKEYVNQIMIALLKQEGGVRSSNENFRKDGTIITCQWYNTKLTDFQGNIIGVLSIVEDITSRKNIEAALISSEARFKKLAANVPGMIYQFRLAPDGTTSFPYVSEGSREIYGIEPEEAQKNAGLLTEAVYLEDKSSFLESVAVSAQTLENWDWQGRIFSQTGKLKWVRGISRPELQSNGSILWDGLLIDISERQQALLDLEHFNKELEHRIEERTVELQQSQQLLKLVFDTLPQRVFWKDKNSKYLGCNQKFALDVGISSPDEIIGKDDFDLFENAIAHLHRTNDNFAIKKNLPKINFEEAQPKEDGTCVWLRKNKIPLCNLEGDVIGVFGSYEDITLEKQAQEALRESEAKFRSFVENSNYLIYSHSLEGIFSYLSPNATDIIGYEPEELIGKSFAHFVDLDDLLTIQQFFNKIINTGNKQTGLEFRFKTKNRTWCWMKASTSPIKNADGDVIGFQGMINDITERKLTREKLLRISKAVESASDAIIIADPKGNSVYHNTAFIEMFGYTVDELNAAGDSSIIYTSKIDAMQVFKNIEIGESWRGEISMNHKNGSIVLVELKADVIKDEAAKIIGLIGIHTDITERKQAEAELTKQTKELEQTLNELKCTQLQLIQSEKMSSLGQLVAGVAHEINNPVNFIFGNLEHAYQYTQNLLKIIDLYQTHYPEPILEIQEEAFEIDLEFLLEDLPRLYSSMTVGANRIREIVASLRTFSRLDEADLKAADIHEGIDSTLMILEHRLKCKPDRPNITVIKEYSDLPLVECYAGQLNQVFMNILANAIDAIEENYKQEDNQQRKPTIHIKTQIITSNQIIIRIKDNGIGISEEVRQKLFDPFYTTKPVGKGTGMGLSISYQIITDRHGGSLQCISSPGKGAEFVIEIPIQQKKI
ncbi:hypothetical protein NIES2101_21470 [Calothrix sp. HK-06]|nr:hypothetical protein NIES2101_21470 [Calothrix sp. HK-06]